ncbi:flagellar biosynthetic protein FliP [Clostridium tetanomorphum]|uniref:Flagellar biosynthetic protein FliP n=1 Tax=Clostridium tetanomorphum TaxID=1553 RepID=A0A923IZ68_CLOTT|nr:flagellar type III secretion system pore protein FliP [Clostridium tetanomorphum]KAJ49923.1 flagellar biosynthesis protein FliP [Clostridium tetanomorphum DSM 665]MBC2396672.1 flagellar type III secretion system pore protein FliP [Clostridium tetanomorphum]MBP1866139.1 flagellar biosynthetic protein FliP [Clostridium tetanomorphum]NRS85118.1 flagellar biosynthetic protein FliP [Clostridium tetanomorphum]NRZ98299.1 flagellar biosynthetic protein FliP [Clostridium tetanomorphum]
MKKNKKAIVIFTAISVALICGVLLVGSKVNAAPANMPIPRVNISLDNAGTPKNYVDNIKILIVLTILTLLPSFIVMMTSFVRITVVFGFLRNAMGTQQSPPNQVLIGLALFLTVFIMTPVYNKLNTNAIQPFLQNKIDQNMAIEEGAKPLREFMLKQTRQKDLKLFMEVAKAGENITKDNVPLYIVVPSFIISELKTAFQIGFLLYIPFLIIDLVVASVLMSMGMFMLPPVMVSLPFKLLLFVMVDGWHLLVKSLIMSFK